MSIATRLGEEESKTKVIQIPSQKITAVNILLYNFMYFYAYTDSHINFLQKWKI